MRKTITTISLGSFLTLWSGLANAAQVDPWMDNLFGAPIKASASDCLATVYDYNEVAHVNGWDCSADEGRLAWIEVARPERVNRDLIKVTRKEVTIPGRTDASGKKTADVEAYQVGDPKKAKFAMVFVHGAGGNKRLAARDTNMGGNFNRLMNLVVRSQGVYYSPTADFSDQGEGIQTIIEKLQKENPGIKLVVACGSAGAAICRDVANRTDSVPHLAGVMFTGAAGGLEDITKSVAYAKNIPMIIAHGSRDGVDSFLESFKQMRKRPDGTNYPVLMQVYNDGGHGTPIRMIDWRASLNWIFSQNEKKPGGDCSIPAPNREPTIAELSTNVKTIQKLDKTFTCEQFLNYPFIRSRSADVNYTATEKSSCVASKKEETPGEEVLIASPSQKK